MIELKAITLLSMADETKYDYLYQLYETCVASVCYINTTISRKGRNKIVLLYRSP